MKSSVYLSVCLFVCRWTKRERKSEASESTRLTKTERERELREFFLSRLSFVFFERGEEKKNFAFTHRLFFFSPLFLFQSFSLFLPPLPPRVLRAHTRRMAAVEETVVVADVAAPVAEGGAEGAAEETVVVIGKTKVLMDALQASKRKKKKKRCWRCSCSPHRERFPAVAAVRPSFLFAAEERTHSLGASDLGFGTDRGQLGAVQRDRRGSMMAQKKREGRRLRPPAPPASALLLFRCCRTTKKTQPSSLFFAFPPPSLFSLNSQTGKRCFVGNLAWRTSWQDLKDKFREVGTVVYANVMRDDSGERD